MPVCVEVDIEDQVVYLTCTGDITAEDLMEYEREYWAGPSHEGFHHYVDFCDCALNLDYSEVLMLATHAAPPDPSAYKGAKTALVVADEEQQQIVQFYKEARHSLCSPDIREIGVFLDPDEADLWVLNSTIEWG